MDASKISPAILRELSDATDHTGGRCTGSRGVQGGQAAFWEYLVKEAHLFPREPPRLFSDAATRPKRGRCGDERGRK